MSSIFHSPKTPKLPPANAEPEPVTTITEEDEGTTQRRQRRFSGYGGAQTRVSGIQNALMSALKKRLGE